MFLSRYGGVSDLAYYLASGQLVGQSEIGYITSFQLIFEMEITKNDSSNVLIHDRHQHPWLTLTTLITTDILLYTDKK